MMLALLLILSVSFVSSQTTPGPGTAVPFDAPGLLLTVNRERQFWNIPLLEYDDDVASIAQLTCSQCDFSTLGSASDRQQQLCNLKGLPLGDPNTARYQTVGENRAASAGLGAVPSAAIWLNRNDWTCATNGCVSNDTCGDYTQAIWNNTLYMGCGQCHCNIKSPEPQSGPDWTYLVCNFVEAGNFNGGHPFGDGAVKDAACSHTYTPLPPPQPAPCNTRKCTDTTACPSPLSAATCNAATGGWEVTGTVKASDFNPIYLACGLTVGGLTAEAGDKFRVGQCGKITVTGATTFSGNITVDLEFEGVTGLHDDFYQAFLSTATPISGGVFGSAIAQSVWSPSALLCAQAITGTTTSYVLIHDCADLSVSVDEPLPDGGTMLPSGQSASSEAIRTSVAGSGGDINDPDLQTEPKKTIDGTPVPSVPQPGVPDANAPNNGSSGGSIPGWAIFLIVLACILIIVVICVIIFLLVGSGGGTEKF